MGGDRAQRWAEPDIEDLGGGVHRIPLPLPMDGLKAVNVYAMVDGDGVDLVDSGMAITRARERLLAALTQLGAGIGDIRNFLITHIHRDHYTLAVELRRLHAPGVIALGEGERSNLAGSRELASGGDGGGSFLADMRRMGAAELVAKLTRPGPGEGRPTVDEWEEPDRWLADDAVVVLKSRTLRAISTPGHTRGHVVFHDAASRNLFAGDHVLPHISPSIGFEPDRNPLALRDYLASLRLMLELPDARLLPAHGPVTDSAHTRVNELLAHHEERLTEALEAVRAADAATAYGVAQRIKWTRRRKSFDELEPVSQLLATGETSAHLEVLVLRGELRSSADPDGTVTYSA